MPPKGLKGKIAEIKAEMLPEANMLTIADNWATTIIPQFTAKASSAFEISTAVSAREASATEVPADVIECVSGLRADSVNLLNNINTLRASILIRIPEIKEEDNLGVNVQILVIKQLEKAEKMMLSGGGGGDDAATPFPALSFKKDYFAARAAIEEKVLGSGKDGEPSKSPSVKLQLQQLDADTAARVGIAYNTLLTTIMTLIAAYAHNNKKLIAPRVDSDRMIH